MTLKHDILLQFDILQSSVFHNYTKYMGEQK